MQKYSEKERVHMICDRCGKELDGEFEIKTILNDVLISAYENLQKIKEPEQQILCAKYIAEIAHYYAITL